MKDSVRVLMHTFYVYARSSSAHICYIYHKYLNMATRYRFGDDEMPHFITTSVVNWIDVFSRETYKQILVESLQHCIDNKGLRLHAWVMFKRAGERNGNNHTYQFWQQDNHPVELSTNEMMDQRLTYTHENPVTAGYVWEPQHYRYSSAIDYYTELTGLLPLELLL